MRLLLVCCAVVVAGACASPAIDYAHNRHDYLAFRARVGSLPEPNYLPYIAHQERLPAGSSALVLCRWPDDAFPLRYHVAPVVIPEEMQDEFNPRGPEEYVEAVHRAFAAWQRELDRPVRFESEDDPGRAAVQVRLHPGMHEAEEVLVLGMVRNQTERCRVTAPSASEDRVEIAFEVPEMHLFMSDTMGLLTPRQVQGIAMHEIGHVLGAAGHSPLRADVMYEVATDRRGEVLSLHDRNTLRSLYKTPPGMIYARLDEPHERPMVEARRGPPRLGPDVRDDRFGFKIRFPKDWQTIRTPRGAIAVDGMSWDYDASVQIVAVRGDLAQFLAQQAPRLVRRGDFVGSDHFEVDGVPMARFITRTDQMTEATSVLQWGDGWLLVVISDCRSQNYDVYDQWFQRVLLSLEPLESTQAAERPDPSERSP